MVHEVHSSDPQTGREGDGSWEAVMVVGDHMDQGLGSSWMLEPSLDSVTRKIKRSREALTWLMTWCRDWEVPVCYCKVEKAFEP